VKTSIRIAATLAYAFSAVALAATAGEDISKVNGSIRVDDGEVAGDISSVNGSVSLGRGASAEQVDTVNGSVRLDTNARVRSAETVNGSVVLAEGVQVGESVSTVNGSMTLGRGASVGGALENVNGTLKLDGASVDGGLQTVNGDIYIGAQSRVAGGIHIEDNRSWFNGNGRSRNPRMTVEAGAIVEGPLRFEREIDLYVAPGVNLPPVEGVAPKRYTLQ
jgi:DUF4097 and DUF4098 domain-containing protein YvlB